MSKKKKEKQDSFENVETALSSAELFVEKNKKSILYALGGVIVIVLLILAFRNFYLKPRETTAANEMYKTQLVFARDSFRVALEGDAQIVGFKEIASDYSITKTGNLANAYAGICYFKLGDYNNAIKYLTQFDGKDKYLSTTVLGLIGDCYANTNETDKAISYFEKAASKTDDVTSPVFLKKAGMAYESVQKFDKALTAYKQIKANYPNSIEGQDIDKYIARVQP
ncbi:MAG: tetratricopeptide repeat protein [Prevotellaceae bacterium]|jgi:tetratricopeptide (TPR) repeat protein|nr:tetratricopeptide repeat protein [Prevotellaceae bacterium]